MNAQTNKSNYHSLPFVGQKYYGQHSSFLTWTKTTSTIVELLVKNTRKAVCLRTSMPQSNRETMCTLRVKREKMGKENEI